MKKNIKNDNLKKVNIEEISIEDIREQNLDTLEKKFSKLQACSTSCSDPGGGGTGGGGA